jgi:neutral ceramidase
MLLEDPAGERVALVAADLHGGSSLVVDLACTAPAVGDMGLDRARVWMLATHTHSGPAHFYGEPFYDDNAPSTGGLNEPLVRWLSAKLCGALQLAVDDLREATIAVGDSHAWGWLRNRSYAASLTEFTGVGDAPSANPFGAPPTGSVPPLGPERTLVDPRTTVIVARDTAQIPIAVMAWVPGHAAVLPRASWLSSGDTHAIASTLAEQSLAQRFGPGVMAAVVAGTIGDLDPTTPWLDRSTDGTVVDEPIEMLHARKTRDGAVQIALAIGAHLAEEVKHALDNAVSLDAAGLKVCLREADASGATVSWRGATGSLAEVPAIGSPTLGGSELGRGVPWAWEGDRMQQPTRDDDPHWPKRLAVLPDIFGAEWFTAMRRRVPIRTLQIGPVCVIGVPGEPTCAMVHAIEGAVRSTVSVNTRPIVSANVGAYLGYWTMPNEYACQHYEGSSTVWGRLSGPWLAEQVAASVRGEGESHPPAHGYRSRSSRGMFVPLPAPLHAAHQDDLSLDLLRAGAQVVLCARWRSVDVRPVDPWDEGAAASGRAWIAIETDATTLAQLEVDRVAVDDAHRIALLELHGKPGRHLWTWTLTLDDGGQCRGQRLRARFLGPDYAHPLGNSVTPFSEAP